MGRVYNKDTSTLFPLGRDSAPTVSRYELRHSLRNALDLSLKASGVNLYKETLDSLADAAMVWIQRQAEPEEGGS